MNRRTIWWCAGGVTAVTVVIMVIGLAVTGAFLDMRVYQAGGAAWTHGVPLYGGEFPFWLPFTYPPVAAVLFSALAMMPVVVATMVLTAVGLAALAVSTRLAAPVRLTGPLVAVAVVVTAFALEPVRSTLAFGQINLVLLGLVALDCLLPRTRYPRGLLIGVAAAVKLTPAVFVLFFLARRQYSAALTTVAGFAGATGLGLLLAPTDSIAYWRTTIFDPDRIGGAAYAANQSLRGALSRFDLSPGLTQTCWLLLAAGVLALTWHGARRAGDPVIALLVVAAGGLLMSPVSWSHHWVWIVPALAVWVTRVYRRAGSVAVLVLTASVFVLGHQFLPNAEDRELEWAWWQHVAGNGYLLVALGFLVWSAVRRVDRPSIVEVTLRLPVQATNGLAEPGGHGRSREERLRQPPHYLGETATPSGR